MHTSLWNGEDNSLSVKVEFYDKNVILGTRDVVVSPSELKDVFIPWKITAGDHTISAKIISSLEVVSSGKKEEIVLTRSSTSNYKQSVSTTLKNDKGETVSISDSIKTEINKVGEKVGEIVPSGVTESVSNKFNSLEDIRSNSGDNIKTAKEDAKKELDFIKKEESTIKFLGEKSSIESVVQKPLAYVKLFLLSVLDFVFSNKIVFYGVIVLLAFYLIRFIYHKIRNR